MAQAQEDHWVAAQRDIQELREMIRELGEELRSHNAASRAITQDLREVCHQKYRRLIHYLNALSRNISQPFQRCVRSLTVSCSVLPNFSRKMVVRNRSFKMTMYSSVQWGF